MEQSEISAFIKLVEEMRNNTQKRYDLIRMSFDLEKSKKLAKEVDRFLKNFSEEAVQKNCFEWR